MRLLSILAITLLSVMVSAQTTWYVSPTGTGNGTSAATPLGSIQAAINAAASNDIVELASGTYSGPQFYNNTINGKSLTVRGQPNSPKPIIDGMLSNARFITANAAAFFGMSSIDIRHFRSNSDAPVYLSNLSNFGITDCAASNNWTHGRGGAFFLWTCQSGSVAQCTISNNLSYTNDGGAFNLYQGSGSTTPIQFDQCQFYQNTAMEGGALSLTNNCNALVSNCTFDLNSSANRGGAVYSGHSITCRETVFSNNFTVNQSDGGAVYSYSLGPTSTFKSCRFVGNSAGRYGGGLFSQDAIIESCDFDQNVATFDGGGACLGGGPDGLVWLRSCVFRRNVAGRYGGGLYRFVYISGCVGRECTFLANSSANVGSAYYSEVVNCNYPMINCIVWGNRRTNGSSASQGAGISQPVNNCMFESIIGVPVSASANLSSLNPLLPIDGSNYHLPLGSPAIGFGDPSFVASSWRDIDGQSRFIGGTLDCGADEFGPFDIQAANVAQIGSGWLMGVKTFPPLPYTPYAVDLSVTGTSPGIPLGFGQIVPLNPPLLNFDYGVYLSTPYPNIFQNFIGLTDANGEANAIFNIPDLPALVGLNVWGAGCVLDSTSPTGIGPISAPVQTLVRDHLPVVSMANPSTAPVAGSAPITITGDYFQPGATVTFGGVLATNVIVTPPTLLTCTAPAHAIGAVDIVVTNPDTQVATLVGGLTYIENLTLTSVVPLVPTTGATVTVSGQGFQQGATVAVGALAIASPSVTPSSITFTMPAGAACGASLSITNPSTQIASLAFNPSPAITSMAGNVGPAAGGVGFTIFGSNFHPGTTVTVGGTTAAITALSPNQIDATSPAGAPGTATIVVASAYGCTASANYYYLGPIATLANVTLNQGPIAGGTNITVTGTEFLTGAAVKIDGVACTIVSVVNSTSITCTTPPGTLGPKTVLLINGDTQQTSLPGGFTYIPNIAINSVTNSSMSPGATVSVSGAGFISGLTMTACGVPVFPVTQTASSLTFLMPAGLACSGQLVVTNPTGQSASVLFNPSPIVTGLVLANGPLVGGNNFVIQGRWFYPGTTVTVGGIPASISSMTPGTATTLGSIVVVAPPSATSGPKPIVVTSPTGCVNSGAFNYTYN